MTTEENTIIRFTTAMIYLVHLPVHVKLTGATMNVCTFAVVWVSRVLACVHTSKCAVFSCAVMS